MEGQVGRGAWLRTVGIALGLLLLALWVHDPRGLHFKADDYPTIAYARDFSRVLRDFVGPQYDLSFFVFHRPLITLSLWGDFVLFGVHPLGFFLMNLLAFWLSLVLLQRIIALVFGGLRGELAGLILALLWLFHPVPIASLEWVVGRVDTHVVPWILGAVFFHLRARRGGAQWPVWLCAFLALLTKESAFGVPFLLLGVDLLDRVSPSGGFATTHKPLIPKNGPGLLRRFPSWSLLALIPLDLLFRWIFLGQLLGGYGFLKTARLDLPAILAGFANTISLSLYPRDFASPLLQWGIPALLLCGLFWYCFQKKGHFWSRFFGIGFLTMGLFGPLALLLPSMRDPSNQRYAYLACMGPWMGVWTLLLLGRTLIKPLIPPSPLSALSLVSPLLLLGLIGLIPSQRREQHRMAVHDRFVAEGVELLGKAAALERGLAKDLPLVLSGKAEAACHPQRFLWGLGSVQKPPFVKDPGLYREVISLRRLHPSALPVPETLATAGLVALIRVRQDGSGLRLVPNRALRVREASPLGFEGKLNLAVQKRAQTLKGRGPGFSLGARFGGEVALCTSLGSYLLKLPPRPRERLTLWELLSSPIRSGGAPLPGLWMLWNAFDLCPSEPLQLFWREGAEVVHARLWVEREFTKGMAQALAGGKR